jgi:hypothetical protein
MAYAMAHAMGQEATPKKKGNEPIDADSDDDDDNDDEEEEEEEDDDDDDTGSYERNVFFF